MALVDIPGPPISYPSLTGTAQASSYTARAIDADGEKVGWVIRCPQDGTLNRVGFCFGTVTQAPTSGLTVSFQNVGTDGNPDGTQDETRLVESGSIASNTWVTTGLITSDGTDDGTKRTVTQGELLAIVVEFASFADSDNLQIRTESLGPWAHSNNLQLPYNLHFTTAWGSRAGQASNIAVQYSDGTWEPIFGCVPSEAIFTTAYAAASNPDERGMQFVAPFTMRTVGFVFHGLLANTNSSFELHLYDSTNTELASASWDPDAIRAGNTAGVFSAYFNGIADSIELSAGDTYRITLEGTGAANVTLYGLTPDSTDFISAMPWGEDAVAISRQNLTGSFTEATDGTQLAISLLVDAVDVSSGSGGGGNVIIRRTYDD